MNKTYFELRRVKSAVESDKSYTICITVNNDGVHLFGEKQLVEEIQENAKNITMKEVFTRLSNIQSEANLNFKDVVTYTLPKLKVHFKSDAWNHVVARSLRIRDGNEIFNGG